MGYPTHWLCTFGGSLGSSEEEHWSCGIRLILSGLNQGGFDPDDWLVNQGDHITEWILRTNSHIGFGTKLQFIKMNEINEFGHYADPEHPHTRFLNVAGGMATSTLPFQACYVVTTRTHAVSAGPASRGRFYVPYPAVTVDSHGLFPTGFADQMASSAHDLLDNLEVGVIGDWSIKPNIVSKVGDGHAHQIDYVIVDNRIDTQRRRANQLRGVKSTSADIVY